MLDASGPTLSATAVRNGSIAARDLLARAALVPGVAALLGAARRGDRRWLRRLRPKARPALLAALAQTIALQDRLPGDRRDALALYALIRDTYGAYALSPAHQSLHAQLTLAWDGPEETAALLKAYRRMRPAVRAALEVDLLNPFAVRSPATTLERTEDSFAVRSPATTLERTEDSAERPPEPWLAAFRALLPDPAPTLDGSPTRPQNLCAFDRLGPATPPAEVEAPHRVSVVITSYRPDEGLITAVRSILAQTWRNIEIIVVDDASPPEYDAVLERVSHQRVRIVRQPRNMGTYAARNVGLDMAGGEFVAFQDDDDWSHPRRLEKQVAPLLADPSLVASTSEGLSVTADLLLNRAGVRTGRFNPSSLVLRRATVVSRIGYFDRLRKAADSEYIGRIGAAFGADAIRHLDEPLALIRLTENSLSRAEIRPHWMHPARVAYRSAYLHWHKAIAAGEAEPFRPADGTDRPFPAPPHLLGQARDDAFDVVVAGDWRYATGPVRSAVDEMRALAAAGLRVALVQMDAYRQAHRLRIPSCPAIQELVNAGVVEHVHLTDACRTELLLVRQAEVLQYAPDDPSALAAARVLVVADRADDSYDPGECAARIRRVFGRSAVWCPQDAGVRAALPPGLELTAADLPAVVDASGWHARRTGASEGGPIVGADLCDGDPITTLARLSDVDVRLRLADGPPDSVAPGVPSDWLVFAAAAVAPRPFLHQLDFYLHVPGPAAAGTLSRPALEAAAAGCVVILPERSAALYGDAAVYAEPAEMPETVRRYASDRELFAEQSRRARAVVPRAHHPELFVDAVMRGRP
ncbi:glycosyltransferase [Actinoplanes sp. NPDC051633]|uniref:glycosyltransferase n=1 Tax=Actinoplanes sp. NPDC051633 TaxID=3155670 RepID=UPI00341D77F5